MVKYYNYATTITTTKDGRKNRRRDGRTERQTNGRMDGDALFLSRCEDASKNIHASTRTYERRCAQVHAHVESRSFPTYST